MPHGAAAGASAARLAGCAAGEAAEGGESGDETQDQWGFCQPHPCGYRVAVVRGVVLLLLPAELPLAVEDLGNTCWGATEGLYLAAPRPLPAPWYALERCIGYLS
jgi:hypothetical protein